MARKYPDSKHLAGKLFEQSQFQSPTIASLAKRTIKEVESLLKEMSTGMVT